MKLLLIGGLGYIGSFLYPHLVAKQYHVDICDDLRRGNPAKFPCKFSFDYHDLSSKELSNYDSILWFGGHSSVTQSMDDPKGAINNNMIHLMDLLKKIPSDNTKFIYASTASLYSGELGLADEDARVVPYNNIYDISKFSFDYLAKNYHSNLYGIRMGTLSGYSKNIRPELIFNQMCLRAYFTKKVIVTNRIKSRSLLFLKDLASIIELLLTSNNATPGFYNAASISTNIDNLSKRISSFFNAELLYGPDSNTYSFQINTAKIEKLGYIKSDNLDLHIAEFIDSIKKNEGSIKKLISNLII